MRILLATHNVYTEFTSGAARSVRTMMEWLAGGGHACRVLCAGWFETTQGAELGPHLAQLGITPRQRAVAGGRTVLDCTIAGVQVSMLATEDYTPSTPDRAEARRYLPAVPGRPARVPPGPGHDLWQPSRAGRGDARLPCRRRGHRADSAGLRLRAPRLVRRYRSSVDQQRVCRAALPRRDWARKRRAAVSNSVVRCSRHRSRATVPDLRESVVAQGGCFVRPPGRHVGTGAPRYPDPDSAVGRGTPSGLASPRGRT